MALNQVGARTQGDVYQGMFFWGEASALLNPKSGVEKVILEHDKASGVDDVVVFYKKEQRSVEGELIEADFYQVKYHVDSRATYCSESFADPSFINAKTSLLQHFYSAYQNIIKEHSSFRLLFASNWNWGADDPLGPYIRDFDGRLPNDFFTKGSRSKLGKIRDSWKTHLGVVDDKEFEDFARKLRFQVNMFGRFQYTDLVKLKLQNAGLKTPNFDQENNPYDSLVQKFVMNAKNEFTVTSFKDLCEREDLIDRHAQKESSYISSNAIGIKSFPRFAERLEDEVSELLSLTHIFEGRHLENGYSWNSDVFNAVSEFAGSEKVQNIITADECFLALDCHSSIAFLIGYLNDLKSGTKLYPIQKGKGRDTWKPSFQEFPNTSWEISEEELDSNYEDIAICLSMSRETKKDVKNYIHQETIEIGKILDCKVQGGVGSQCIKGADHAWTLSDQLANKIREFKVGKPKATVHLFGASANGFMYFLGQQGAALGKVQLYEFDFTSEKDCTYSPSIKVPSN